ncbi:hypothetical protein DRO97_04810 [Archaeoglobales archaeon]|nr:MAG: hypothetical protein DRO97_04810 [Archaeoglobales archaeon]
MTLNAAWCVEKLVEILRKEEFDTVFINLPIEFEPYFRSKSFTELQRIATFYIHDLNALEPLVNANLNIKIYCYKDNDHSNKERNTSIDLLNLVLRAKLGRINVEEWKEVIMDDLKSNTEFAEYEAIRIVERVGNKNACLNLNEEVESFLRKEGFEVEKVWLYDFSRPIDKLYNLVKKEMNGEIIDDKEFEELIHKHIKFIDTVIEIGYDEACKLIWE